MKRRMISLYVAFFLSLAILPTTALAALSSAPTKVRVGFYGLDGYHMIDEKGYRSGYGYDVLQLMARYEEFEYEYIGYEATFDEMLSMLEQGEIDLLTCVVKFPERQEKLEFSEISLGHTSTNLTIREGDEHFVVGDHATYDGMTVGLLHNSYRNYGFEEHARAEGVEFKPVYFDHTDSMVIALQDKKIDAIVTSSLRAIGENEHLIERFNETPFYIASTKGNTELMKKVNRALEAMDRYEGNWRLILDEKYYAKTDSHLNLEIDEYEYIQELQNLEQPLKVLMNPDRYPYSYFEDREAKGILVDYFAAIAQRIHLPYEFIYVENRDQYMELLRSGQTDIYLDGLNMPSLAENKGYRITDPYFTTDFVLLMPKDFSGTIRRAALVKHSSIGDRGYEGLSQNIIYFTYDSHDECLNALKNGDVDIYCTYDYSAERILFEDETGNLTTKQSGASIDFTIGISQKQSNQLLSLINKSLKNIDQETVNELIHNNTNWGIPPMTFNRFLHKYPQQAALFFISTLLLVFAGSFILLQRRHQKELEQAVMEAEAANRSKSEFLSQMSHDIRTPINGLMGMIELAQRNMDDVSKVSIYLRKMQGASNHLALLVNDVLDMAKVDNEGTKNEMEVLPFYLPDLLEDCISIVDGRILGRNLEFITDIKDIEHPDLIGSKIYLSRVLINILGNAVKYTKDGGKVRFHVHEVSSDEENASFVFSVQDTGIGMSEEFQKHLFEAFAQEDTGGAGLFQGTGLGMTIAKRLTDRMNGTLTVDSKLGVGSTFTLTLSFPLSPDEVPRRQQYTDPAAPVASPVPAVPSAPAVPVISESTGDIQGAIHVMVVEDVELNQEFVLSILEDEGIRVTIAEDGAQAVELFRTAPPGTYHLIFMDIRMPVMDGHQAAETIRTMPDRPDGAVIPIVAMSANAYVEDIERSKAVGMNAHLSKPIKAIEILQAVEDYAAVSS